jgi:hypothetical protein
MAAGGTDAGLCGEDGDGAAPNSTSLLLREVFPVFIAIHEEDESTLSPDDLQWVGEHFVSGNAPGAHKAERCVPAYLRPLYTVALGLETNFEVCHSCTLEFVHRRLGFTIAFHRTSDLAELVKDCHLGGRSFQQLKDEMRHMLDRFKSEGGSSLPTTRPKACTSKRTKKQGQYKDIEAFFKDRQQSPQEERQRLLGEQQRPLGQDNPKQEKPEQRRRRRQPAPTGIRLGTFLKQGQKQGHSSRPRTTQRPANRTPSEGAAFLSMHPQPLRPLTERLGGGGAC